MSMSSVNQCLSILMFQMWNLSVSVYNVYSVLRGIVRFVMIVILISVLFDFCLCVCSIYNVVQLLLIMLIVLSLASLLTVLERKGLASSQRRMGPSYNGWYGLVQIVQDGLKLIYKDYNLNNNINNKYIALSCIMNFIYSYLLFLFLYMDLILYINMSFLLIMVVILLMVNHISIIICGIIISNSKWTILSSVRLIIIFIIYDIMFLLLFLVLLPNCGVGVSNMYCNNLLNLNMYLDSQSSMYNVFKYPLLCVFYVFMVLIEGGRIPVDLIEAESELISGYSIEYSGFLYALFASAEYSVILFHSFLLCILFMCSSSFYVSYLWITFLFVLFIIIRSTLPRVIYSHLLVSCYHYLLPVPLLYMFLCAIF